MKTNLTNAARSRGGTVSAARRRAARIALLETMTKKQIAQTWYQKGWHTCQRAYEKRLLAA